MAETTTAANSSRSPVENVPPPWRSENAITSAAPVIEAIQNSGLGRSWVMATATSAVAIGSTPSTTPPCEASTRCIPIDISSGNSTATQSIAMTSCRQSARGGSGRRSTSSSASEHTPAIAVRSAVSAIGSISATAIRVAGSVPPKITMPMKPSSRPSRSREAGEDMAREDMARVDSRFAVQRTAIYSEHMAAMRCYLGAMLLHNNPSPDRNSSARTMS